MASNTHGDPAQGVPDRIRAAIIDGPGAQPHVGTVEFAAPAPGYSVLRVVAAPVNPLDLLIASGTFHSARYEQPYVPGSECVGVVSNPARTQWEPRCMPSVRQHLTAPVH